MGTAHPSKKKKNPTTVDPFTGERKDKRKEKPKWNHHHFRHNNGHKGSLRHTLQKKKKTQQQWTPSQVKGRTKEKKNQRGPQPIKKKKRRTTTNWTFTEYTTKSGQTVNASSQDIRRS